MRESTKLWFVGAFGLMSLAIVVGMIGELNARIAQQNDTVAAKCMAKGGLPLYQDGGVFCAGVKA